MQIFPQYRFSLRGLLLFVTAISVVLGTYSLFEVIGASLALAVIGAAMYQIGMKYNNTPFSVAGFFLSMITSLLTVAWLFNWLILGEGPIYWQRNWPPELREMAKASSAPHRIIARRESSYDDYYGGQFRWRIPLSPAQHAMVVQQHGWAVMPANEVPPDFWQFPALWQPRHRAENLYHRSGPSILSGYFSPPSYYTMYDPRQQEFYVYCRRDR